MTDFDPDAYLASKGQQQPSQEFDPDAYLSSRGTAPAASLTPPVTYDAAEFKRRVGRDPEPAELANFKASKGVGWAGDPTQGKFSMGQAAVGGVEDAASLATGTILGAPAAAAGYVYGLTGANGSTSLSAARSARNAVTYSPRTEAGQAGIESISQIKPGEVIPRLLDVGGYPNAAETTREVEERAGDVAPLVPAVRSFVPAARNLGRRVLSSVHDPEAIEGEFVPSNMNSQQSMGDAAASPNLAGMSPELRQAVSTEAQKTGGAVNQAALARHAEADSLPVKMQLTEGQATQDPTVLSNEVNSRGANKEIADRYNQQNEQLKQNVQAIRDRAGPDVFSANHVEHGDTLISAYKEKAAAADADIDAKYQALRDANGGQFPIDAKQLQKNVETALHQKLLYEHAPELSTLSRLADEGMNFEQFEALRTNLARTMRSSTDGNEVAAARVIRQEMEKLPLSGDAAKLKPLADAARSAAKAQFDAVETDPAYKAAVNDSVPPDRFVQKYIVNGNRDDVARMRANFQGNDTAQQTMGVAAIDHLRRAAGIDDSGSGNFSQARYNKALQSLSPKLRSIIDPKTADQLETLGNVARYTQAQPRGSFVNNSNTFVAQAGHAAANILEGAANIKAGGFPVGTIVRQQVAKRAQAKATREALKPGAGLGRLPTSQ